MTSQQIIDTIFIQSLRYGGKIGQTRIARLLDTYGVHADDIRRAVEEYEAGRVALPHGYVLSQCGAGVRGDPVVFHLTSCVNE